MESQAAQKIPAGTCESSSTSPLINRMNITFAPHRSTFALRLRIGPGRRSRTSTFEFKARRAAVTPSRNEISGHWDSNPEPCADLALTPLIRRLLSQLSYAPESVSYAEKFGRGGRS